MKFPKQAVKLVNADIMSSCKYGSNPGLKFHTSQTGSGYDAQINPDGPNEWLLHGFGKGVLALKWTNFIITYHKDRGMCAYINGRLDTCANITRTRTLTPDNSIRCFILGYGTSILPENTIFYDDFAVWNDVLEPADVKEIYTQGAK